MKKNLEARLNMLVYGKSGWGKTQAIYEYAEEHDLMIMNFDLVSKLVEEVGGIPAIVTIGGERLYKEDLARALRGVTDADEIIRIIDEFESKRDASGQYYRKCMDIEMKEFFDCKGAGYILLFDEVNQGQPETLNTLYTITHPNPKMRRWAGHDISECQIVALGNLNDGRDGTVYLTDLPTPLENRFFVFELETSKKDATDFLKEKWKNIPQVAKYIKTMLDADISPRDVDQCLEVLQYEYDGSFLEAKLGTALTQKILDLQKNIRSINPAEMLMNAKAIYNKFKEDGEVLFGAETITSEDALKSKFSEFLSEEEIASVMKGDE